MFYAYKDKYRYLCMFMSKFLLANYYKTSQETLNIVQEKFVLI